MLKVEDKLQDNVDDDVRSVLLTLNTRPTWDGERLALFEHLKHLLGEHEYKSFKSDGRRYHLYRKGQACLYDVPANQQGFLKTFRSKRIRLVCLGAWDSYSGRMYAVAEVPIIKLYDVH
jgi:hypothetical protein